VSFQVNGDAATTTHLQIYRSTEVAEASWLRHKSNMKWTISSLGQGAYESLKVQHLGATFRGRWPVIGQYEKCLSFYRDAKKCKLTSGATLWDEYDRWCMTAVDFKAHTLHSQQHKQHKQLTATVPFTLCVITLC